MPLPTTRSRSALARYVRTEQPAVHASAHGSLRTESDAPSRSERRLLDLSSLARTGFVGERSAARLGQLGLRVPHDTFRAESQQDGSLLARIGSHEFLRVGPLSGGPDPVAGAHQFGEDPNCFQKRWQSSHSWIALVGAGSRDYLTGLCALDLSDRACPDKTCVPAMFAHAPGVILRWDLPTVLSLHLLVPRPYSIAVFEFLAQLVIADGGVVDVVNP